MSTATTTLMTADEFMRTLGGETYVDLVDGKVEYQPMPHKRHGIVSYKVSSILGRFIEDRDLGRVAINDTHVRIRSNPDTLRGADVLFVSYSRLPKGPYEDGVVDPAPELVVEVRSPSNTWAQFLRKGLDYLEAGVVVVLLVDIDSATVTALRRDEIQQVFDNGDELTLPDVLPGFSVPVKRFFE